MLPRRRHAARRHDDYLCDAVSATFFHVYSPFLEATCEIMTRAACTRRRYRRRALTALLVFAHASTHSRRAMTSTTRRALLMHEFL